MTALHAVVIGLSLALLATAVTLPSFPAGSPWTVDVSATTPDPDAVAVSNWCMAQSGCFGAGGGALQADFSIQYFEADCSTPRVPFTPAQYYYGDSCFNITEFPIPDVGALEGHGSWADSVRCAGDCHLLVYDTQTGFLYESFATSVNVSGGRVTAMSSLCVIIWDTSMDYGTNGIGDGCTSADAAGFPMAPLLYTPEEVAAGSINHAIRFTLPNNHMRQGAYRHPASHYGGPTSPQNYSVWYGSHFRLKSTFDASPFNTGEKVVIAALKKYGMYLSDGGNIPLTGMNDTFSPVKWADVGISTTSLNSIHFDDFELMPGFGAHARQGPFGSRPSCQRKVSAYFTDPCLSLTTSSTTTGTGGATTVGTSTSSTTTTTTGSGSTGGASATPAPTHTPTRNPGSSLSRTPSPSAACSGPTVCQTSCELIAPSKVPKPSVNPTKLPAASKVPEPQYYTIEVTYESAASDCPPDCCALREALGGSAASYSWLLCDDQSITGRAPAYDDKKGTCSVFIYAREGTGAGEIDDADFTAAQTALDGSLTCVDPKNCVFVAKSGQPYSAIVKSAAVGSAVASLAMLLVAGVLAL